MIKKRLLILTVVVCSLAASAIPVLAHKQLKGQNIIKMGDKKIHIVKDTKDILADNVTASKINTYEGLIGYDWLSENKMLVSKENKELDPIKNNLGEFKVQSLYSYDLNSKTEKSIADKSKLQSYAISSPDKKHVFYVNDFEKENMGCITDSEGNIKVKINEPSMDMADLTQAQWINNEELIMPYMNIKGFYIVKIDGTSTKIANVEKEQMATGDAPNFHNEALFNGMCIMNPVMVGNKIYYRTQQREEKKMKVYDIKTKQTKEFTNEQIFNFKLSPDKNHFIMEVNYPNKQNNALIVTDLNGENVQTLDEGFIFGENWSPDGTKVSYISNEDGNEGIYVVDIRTKKKSLISKGEYYTPSAWSPSGKKIMVHSTEQKDGSTVDITNIITLD
ncbi:DUF5050 domain-containing protein [Clostridium peptidivorans]|uniref:DUF5050 domain-containing protein n=1 Tax=Clostridium peptidivorans TaxID=100174 RepID=UPI000BE3B5C1|nr:DUF5050 domain-containing protein [Clostridium peptidivorans]